MVIKHEAVCDRCERIGELRIDDAGKFILPICWEEIDNCRILCVGCNGDYINSIKIFWKKFMEEYK